MTLGINARDNCCILHDGSICIIINITMDNNSYRLAVKRFLEVGDFYDVGMASSCFKMYKCTTLSSESFYIPLDEVYGKCYRMPHWDSISMDDSDSDGDDHSERQYIIAVIIHSEKV